MLKSTKIILAAISVVLIICIVIVGISIGNSKKNNDSDTITVDPTASTTQYIGDVTESTEESTTAGPELSTLILGAWMDSADMSGFEFYEDGKVKVTFINITIPFLDLPINGSANGTYTIEDSTITMKYSIYSHTETRVYNASVNGNELTLVNFEDSEVSTYQKVEYVPSQNDPETSINDDLLGTWVNAESTVKYRFNYDSSVDVIFNNAKINSISLTPLNGTYTGIYLSQNDKIIIQYAVKGKKITENYSFNVTTNSLSLTDESGNTDLYIREGTGSGVASIATAESLIGTWKDSAGSSGYKFIDGGIVEITYVDFVVPVINMPISGKFKGTYTVSGDELTLRYSALGKAVTSVYTFSVSGNTLTLTDTESGKVSSYIK